MSPTKKTSPKKKTAKKRKTSTKARSKKAAPKRSDPSSLMISSVRARLGAKSASIASAMEFRSEPRYFIPTGIDVVDRYVLTNGGLAGGRVSEVFGGEGAGKTSLVYSCLGQVQAMGGVAVLVHTEEAGQKSRLPTFGVDMDSLIVIEENKDGETLSLEEALQAIQEVLRPIAAMPIKDQPPVLVAWDSLAATATTDERSKGVGVGGFDVRAKTLSQAYRSLVGLIARSGAHLMVVNQNRTKIGVMFGNPTTQPGGHAPKYHASTRLEAFSGKSWTRGTEPAGKHVTIKAWKHKLGKPLRKAVCRLDFDRGWDDDWSTLKLAKDWKLLPSRGAGSQDVSAARVMLGKIGWDPGRVGELTAEDLDAAGSGPHSDDADPDFAGYDVDADIGEDGES